MVYIESPSTNPAFNLALEQYVFDRMDRSQEYFMLWQNDNTVVIGKNQNAFAEVNQKVAVSRLQSCCVLSMCLLRSMAETISALKGKNSPAIPSI